MMNVDILFTLVLRTCFANIKSEGHYTLRFVYWNWNTGTGTYRGLTFSDTVMVVYYLKKVCSTYGFDLQHAVCVF